MRKNAIRRMANNQLMNDNRGSHRDKKYRHFVVHKVIHDLFKLELLPSKWHGLTQEHIRALVLYWKKKKIQPATMMKYMTVLRYFFNRIDHTIPDIDNQTLGIVRARPQAKQRPSTIDMLEKLSHPIARIIFQLQSAFGLTFSEVTRLISNHHIREYSVWITRDIAFNHQDRVIPIRHDEQLYVLQSFASQTENHHSLITAQGYHAIRQIYSTAMKKAGFSSLKSYRYLYAKNQSQELLKVFSTQEANEMIMREMGLKSRTTLWGYLHE
jgi:hypothetical protein